VALGAMNWGTDSLRTPQKAWARAHFLATATLPTDPRLRRAANSLKGTACME
jgi:hypothetical protein